LHIEEDDLITHCSHRCLRFSLLFLLLLPVEQPDLVEDVPAHCRGLGLDDL